MGFRLAALLGALVFAGSGWAAVRASLVPRLGPLDGKAVEFRGAAAADLRRFDYGWGVEVNLHAVDQGGGWTEVRLRAWVSGSGRLSPVVAGQAVSGWGVLRSVERGRSGFEAYLADRGVAALLEGRLRARGPPGNPALRLANVVRTAIRNGTELSLPDREGGLLLGLAIGDTASMDPEVQEDFRASGLGHLLAVSGSNVAMVLAPVLALAGRLRIRLGGRVAAGAVAVGFFALLTRWEPSVLRASAMALVALAGAWAGRPRSTAAALGAAVLALLVADPNLVGSVGFQLSVAATAGLAVLAGPLAARLRWLPRPVAFAAAATMAAQAAVTPPLLLHFGVVPTVTLLANVLAFPAVAPALAVGLAATGGGLVWAPLGRVLGSLASAPLGYLAGLADAMARFPLPSLTGHGPLVAVAAALVMIAAGRLRRGRRPVRALAVAVIFAAVGWSSAPVAGPPGKLTVTFLDVGQGDAAVVLAPDGGVVLIDAGPDEDQVAAELASLGVRRIDLAVASHAHADHVTGFPAVLARYRVGLFIEPGCPYDSPQYHNLLEALRAEEVRVRHPRGGQRLTVGSLTVEVLGPDACSPPGTPEPNNESLVLRLMHRGASVLFPGDAEVPAQQDLLQDGDPVQATVLKVPHQGGDTSDPAFFEAVGAQVAVVSVGPNTYGHPVTSVLAKLEAEGMLVLRTDLEGDITVRFGPGGVLVESERS